MKVSDLVTCHLDDYLSSDGEDGYHRILFIVTNARSEVFRMKHTDYVHVEVINPINGAKFEFREEDLKVLNEDW